MTLTINEGDAFIKGRSREVAADLLERAEALGIDTSLVRTTSHGYIVPVALVEETEEAKTDDTTADDDKGATSAPADEAKELETEVPEEKFDPSDHTVAEITAYIAEAEEEERTRVLNLEANGKNRAAFRDNTDTEGAK